MNIFSKVKMSRPRLNKFDLSHERKFSLNMGDIVPIMCQEILPGDKFRVSSEIMMRFAPLLAPIMHRVNVTTHYFFVPNRLVWNEWEDFITGGREGTSMPVAPWINNGVIKDYTGNGSLGDYMGLPDISASTSEYETKFSVLPFRAYQMIYNEYYRDQNLQEEVNYGGHGSGQQLNDGTIPALFALRKRAWEKDYFTSALPWAQRGPEVQIPIEGEGGVTYRTHNTVVDENGDPIDVTGLESIPSPSAGTLVDSSTGDPVGIRNIASVFVDNVNTTINDLRRSIKLQEWLEKNARGGARYIEQILSHFGVQSSDARLQRPEYLGGGRQPCVISEVLSTYQAPEGEGNPQANMAGHGISVGNTNRFSRRFEEHGYVIGVMSVLPRTTYQQGVPRHFSRFDKFDYAWPEFAHLGEQEIKNKEVYFAETDTNEDTFGYTPRYAEYKYAPSTVHGEMRSSLAFWHMGRIFETPPVLNADFVTSNPTSRIFAVEDGEKLYVQMYNHVSALRPLPYFGTPTF